MNAKILFVIIVLSAGTGLMTSGFASNEATINNDRKEIKGKNTDKSDSAASAKAFLQVYKVLMSPRCMNCHPAGDIPLQGDDSHLHTMSPKRGKDGHGLYAMKCANCHQPANTPGARTPPGNPKWGLPPSDMKMVFQGKTARQLALQIRDYNQNGHKNKQQLLEHARDTLVKAGWNMGEGRPAPPLTYTAFLKVWDEWINKGAYAPSK
jgi:mono/diheme cytochrome c family protein